MHLFSVQALLIGVGLCTAAARLAETPAPPVSTVREIEAGGFSLWSPVRTHSRWWMETERDGRLCWN